MVCLPRLFSLVIGAHVPAAPYDIMVEPIDSHLSLATGGLCCDAVSRMVREYRFYDGFQDSKVPEWSELCQKETLHSSSLRKPFWSSSD
jgi:hypothetical protein